MTTSGKQPLSKTAPETRRYDILGVEVDSLNMDAASKLIIDRAADPRQPACYVVKPYVEYLDRARTDARTRRLIADAWLSLPDAVSTQWAAAYLYGGQRSWWRVIYLGLAIMVYPRAIRSQLPQKFGGANFAWALLKAASAKGLKVYIIGSPVDSDISVTARAIRRRLPKLELVGTWPGHFKGKGDAGLIRSLQRGSIEQELVEDLKSKQPDIILVGMGFPLQEELMSKVAPQLTHGVLIGEGGTFDYDSFGGQRRRAPEFIQNIGLEWLWRLALQPSRWRRQLAIPRFIWSVYRFRRN